MEYLEEILGHLEKKLLRINLDFGFLPYMYGNPVYEIKRIDENKFIGSWKSWSGSGQFTTPCLLEKVDDPYSFFEPEDIKELNTTYKKFKSLETYGSNLEEIETEITFNTKFELGLLDIILCYSQDLDYVKKEVIESDEDNQCNFCGKKSDFYFIYARDDEDYSDEDTSYVGEYKWQYRSFICYDCLDELSHEIDDYNLEIHGIFPINYQLNDMKLAEFFNKQKKKYIWEGTSKKKKCTYCGKKEMKYYIFFQLNNNSKILYSTVCKTCLRILLSNETVNYPIIFPINWKWFGRP